MLSTTVSKTETSRRAHKGNVQYAAIPLNPKIAGEPTKGQTELPPQYTSTPRTMKRKPTTSNNLLRPYMCKRPRA